MSENSGTYQPALGYPLDIQLDGSWPGLAAETGKTRFRPEEMKAVATWLRSKAAELESLPTNLRSEVGSTQFGPAAWVQATNLATTNAQVTNTVGEYWALVLTNLNRAADAIEASADQLATMELANIDMIKAEEAAIVTPVVAPGLGTKVNKI